MFKEIDRFEKLFLNLFEVGVIRIYFDWIVDFLWNVRSDEKIDINVVKKVFDEDYYGFMKVKERIFEYIVVRKLKNDMKGFILCLVGLSGVGKILIVKLIVCVFNRNYVRILFGGFCDEVEI